MARSKLIDELLAEGPVITDGAWGTELIARGLGLRAKADLWNLSHPKQVAAVASSYVKAGSQVILTNTFRANRIAFDASSDRGQLEAINRRGVALSKQAAGESVRVFASIGPSGRQLLKRQVSDGELSAAFEEQAWALASGGADALVIETMTGLGEMKLAVAAARKTRLPLVACMVFGLKEQQKDSADGLAPGEVARRLADWGVDVVGANCGLGIESFLPVCEGLASGCALPVWIKANAGLPEIVDGFTRYFTGPQAFANYLPALMNAGADFIGGCCGTSPGFIAALVAAKADLSDNTMCNPP